MRSNFFATLCGCAAGLWGMLQVSFALAAIDPGFHRPLLGPKKAQGVIVWSHGRSIWAEDDQSPTPPYLLSLRGAGWDVLRFDRKREGDTLEESSRRLARHAALFKKEGYKRVVLAGQSFGAFLALIAADQSSAVDAVVATAPAAFGSFQEFYGSWRLNASRLYPLLRRVKRARVMLFFFHGDDFDPGGRAAMARAILEKRRLGYAVIDQPEYFVGHLAAGSGLFMRRFGGCIRAFAADDALEGAFSCHPVWGEAPSAQLLLPPELGGRPQRLKAPSATTAASGSGEVPAGPVRDAWYGFYPNGREVLIAIEGLQGDHVVAVYALGPGIRRSEKAFWTRFRGRLVDHAYLLGKRGERRLRLYPRPDGSLGVTAFAANGEREMRASLRPLDRLRFARSPVGKDGAYAQ
jgi:hypothetical protein